MSTLLDSVSIILSSFLSWFLSCTLDLITNPFIIILLGIYIALLIYKIIIRLTRKSSYMVSYYDGKNYHSSVTYYNEKKERARSSDTDYLSTHWT